MPLTGAAAARLYDDHVDAVHAMITRRVGSAASPDIVAEAFEHALRTWERFDRDRGTERLFLFGAASAVLRRHEEAERDHLRSLSLRNDLTSATTPTVDPLVRGLKPHEPRVVAHAANDDLLAAAAPDGSPNGSAVMAEVADLATDDRDIVLLSLWESCSQTAIAEVLQLSVGAVRSALGRTRRELKVATTVSKRATVNVLDEIQGSRPDVTPIPLANRRMIRESLFGIGHADATRNIARRSDTGAVVSTAPHGMRRPIQKRPRSSGSLAKVGAGLLVFIGLGAAVWSYSTRVDTTETAATTTTTTTSTTTSTIVVPSTMAPLVRTGVSAEAPLALPATPLEVDGDVVVAPPAPGSSSAILGAPDGTEVWIAEFDGEPSDPSGLDIRQVGAVGVGVDRDAAENSLASYRLQVPCGFVIVNDAPGQPYDRQPIIDLFSATSIDGDANIDITLPTDWSVFSIGDARTSYTAQFLLPAGDDGNDDTRPLHLTQAPGGPFAQLMFGGRQLESVDFLGGPAFIDIGSADPTLTSVFWQDAQTVFNASSNVLTLTEIEAFVDSLEPVTVIDWFERFGTTEPAPETEPPACAPQPSFGATLRP